MRKYLNKPMKGLAGELAAGLTRLKKGYIDAAESLMRIINPDQEYPYDFVVYRLTGYRPARSTQPRGSFSGRSLRNDLLQLMLDVCDSFDLTLDDYHEPVMDTGGLARRFRVSTKTIQRWRKRGPPARRLIFPDGKRRIAFLEDSVRWFTENHMQQVLRSTKFTQMTADQRRDVLRRARRMSSRTGCTLSDVVKRLSRGTGRAPETIRYTLRKHDLEHPEDPIFPYLTGVLGDKEKGTIYQSFLRGVSVGVLSKRYRRTRGSIYRIINEVRAQQLLQRPIICMYNPQFDLPNADKLILDPDADHPLRTARGAPPRLPTDLPPYLKALYEIPLLTPEQERDLFRRYNYLKHKGDKLRRGIDLNHIKTSQLKQVEALLLRANVVKNQIIRANLRLVVSIAKKHVATGPQGLFELVSDGNVTLMRAVERFDFSRGNRFSTYASWAIIRSFARSVPKERYRSVRFTTGLDEILDIAAGLRAYDPNEVNIPELRESIDAMLGQLTPRERRILIGHYGLEESTEPRTLEQIGKTMGISKERVRQIEMQALGKLRKIAKPESAGLLS